MPLISPVNAPIIVPEEYRTLAPFISLVEKMGGLYTQHFSVGKHKQAVRTSFDVFYEGTLALSNTTKPLFAAMLKGLLSPVTTAETLNINMVNAEIIAKERGILINESRSRDSIEGEGYSSSVTLRTRINPRSPSASRSSQPHFASNPNEADKSLSDQVITGFVSNNVPYISRLGRFRTSFVPSGTLLICRNYDEPGKIGVVGGVLGKAGINIRFMSVAPIEQDEDSKKNTDGALQNGTSEAASDRAMNNGNSNHNEALMILGVDRLPDDTVLQGLKDVEGILEASVVVL